MKDTNFSHELTYSCHTVTQEWYKLIKYHRYDCEYLTRPCMCFENLHEYTHKPTYTILLVHSHTDSLKHTDTTNTHTGKHSHLHKLMYTHAHIHIYIYVFTNVLVDIHVYIYTYTRLAHKCHSLNVTLSFFLSFFLSLFSKTQPTHWTKRMANTRLDT